MRRRLLMWRLLCGREAASEVDFPKVMTLLSHVGAPIQGSYTWT